MFIFPKCPFALVLIFPGAHLPQILIFPNSQFAPSSFLPFALCPGAHLPQVPICLKCSFTLNSPYLQMPICHSAHHFPKSPFVPVPTSPNAHLPQVPNSPGPKCLGPSICPGPILSNAIPCCLRNGFLRFYSV